MSSQKVAFYYQGSLSGLFAHCKYYTQTWSATVEVGGLTVACPSWGFDSGLPQLGARQWQSSLLCGQGDGEEIEASC